MIVLTVLCETDHEFEGWFASAEAFETQREARAIACPACGSTRVRRGLSAPNVATRKGREAEPVTAMKPGLSADQHRLRAVLAALKAEVEASCDYVGEAFAEEARAIHYGESDPRGIYGEASGAEVEALLEEGITIAPLPRLPDEAN
ncbi:MAG: DUF1178 family protein [Alphaproteobacteria bacterium]|nr:DUF1178 family protein [Alphaproteobacteria bacterium]